MKKVLILGGGGMLGHKAYQVFSQEFDTYATFRNFNKRVRDLKIFDEKKIFDKADAFEIRRFDEIISILKPDVVLNCIGVIKQLKEAHNPRLSIYTNSLFPHLIAGICESNNSKLIQVSTDCVFSGRRGYYIEEDISDAEDLYGRSKYLGEVNYGNNLVIRTSIIGHELFTDYSLVDWFLSQKNNSVNGFVNAIYTGFPTVTFCRELVRMIKEFPSLKGMRHISSEKISKYDLLKLLKNIYGSKTEINISKDFHCDRSLNSEKYRNETGFKPESWSEMIKEMYADKIQTQLAKNDFR